MLFRSQRSEANSTVNYQLALLDLADATGMVPGRAGLSIDSDIRLPAPESGDPGQDPEAFLRIPSLLQAEREATGGVAPPASAPRGPVAPSISDSR